MACRADAGCGRACRALVYEFPGNVRELSNIIERALILAEPGEPITRAHLSNNLQETPLAGAKPS